MKIKKITSERARANEGIIRYLSSSNGFDVRVRLMLLNELQNRNKWTYHNLREHLEAFKGTPILISYKDGQLGAGHEVDKVKDATGRVTQSFMSESAERIVGYIPETANVYIDNIDGTDWIVTDDAVIFGWYAPELAKRLKGTGTLSMSEKKERSMRVSIETLIDEGIEHPDKSEEFYRYRILGTTILNDEVTEAVAGANIRALSMLGVETIREMTKLRVASALEAEKQSENEPKKINKKGEKTQMKLKDLEKNLPDFSVLAVNGENVALTNEENEFYVCNATSENGEIVIGAKMPIENVNFVSGDTNVTVDLTKIVGRINAKLEKANNDYTAEHEARINAETELEKMRKEENERRKNAVISARDKRIAEISETMSTKFDEQIFADLCTDECVNKYVGMVDAEGKFCGDTAIQKEIDTRSLSQLLENEKKNAATRMNGRSFIFENGEGIKAVANAENKGVSASASRLSKANGSK